MTNLKKKSRKPGSRRNVVGAVRDTSSNDTSSTTTLRRKFLSNYQFVEK